MTIFKTKQELIEEVNNRENDTRICAVYYTEDYAERVIEEVKEYVINDLLELSDRDSLEDKKYVEEEIDKKNWMKLWRNYMIILYYNSSSYDYQNVSENIISEEFLHVVDKFENTKNKNE